ncbi:hypothetical protein M0805_001709 [Coniferiporia weirii]|nr:hypothetical protein M0805_001709 [Coniferiporia weirii]
MSNLDRGRPPTVINVLDAHAVIPKGAQGISGNGKSASERSVVLASTQRAIRLRNGKGGSFGLGEIVRISGREKLELIAEDEMERTKAKKKAIYEASLRNSLRAPFNIEVSMKIAQSQMDAYIDLVNALHNSEGCFDIVLTEIQAQCPPRKSIKDPDLMRSASFVAEQFAICVHNAYMLASGWTIVFESLSMMQNMGLTDGLVLGQLRSSDKMRKIYLSAFDLLKKLVASSQQRLRSIVQNTEHYHVYFKASSTLKGRREFEDSEIRKMYKSFLDSTIIELCLPGSKFTPQALYSCLNAIELESPRELRRCPQIMWDAVGDLAEAVRLLDLMETPLLNAEGSLQFADYPDEYVEFASWDDAQGVSIQAALQYSSFVNLVHPLTNIKNKTTLVKTWDRVNANYIRETGKSIDALWQLVDVRERIPHFSIVFVPSDVLDEYGGASKLTHEGGGRSGKTRMAITANGEDSDGSMPELLDASDSEDENSITDGTDTDHSYLFDGDNGSDDGDDEAYDTDEEDELRKLHREAMNIINEMPEILDLTADNDKYASERKKNPFLKLLGNLKGRMFSSGSALRTNDRTTSTSRSPVPKAPISRGLDGKSPGAHNGHGARTSESFAMDGDGESDEPKSGKKKKSKKKKKKKASLSGESFQPPPSSPVSEFVTPSAPSSPPVREVTPLQHPVAPQRARGSPNKSSKTPSIDASLVSLNLTDSTALESTTTLPLPAPQKAESARSYLAKLSGTKAKVKTRPEQLVDVPEKLRHRLFDRFGESNTNRAKETKPVNSANVFGNLKKKTGALARKLLGVSPQDKKGSLKWEQFLQIMRELGFEYDPSTAGSSVRFDPPNPNDRSISFHKPHPDPTLYQNKLKQYRDKLKEYYDWSPEKFQKAMDNIGGMSSDDSEID